MRQARITAWLVLILVCILGADIVSLGLRRPTMYHLDVGTWYDAELQLLQGVFAPEVAPDGTTYRWTAGEGSFTARGFASVLRPLLTLSIRGVPQVAETPRTLHLSLDGTPLMLPVAAAARQYHLALPARALTDGNLRITFASATSRLPPDVREVGFRLDDIALGWATKTWALPDWSTVMIQWTLVVTWLAIAWRLGVPRWSWFGLVPAFIMLLSWMTAYTLLTATAWQSRLMASSAVLLALVWNAVPVLERVCPELGTRREVRLLCGITVVAIAIGLFGLSYPQFASHDLYIHDQRLLAVQEGRLQIFDSPSEFAGRRTIVPPVFYMLASPFTLLTETPGVALQSVYGFLDGLSGLLIAMVVRQLGGSSRAALIAALGLLSAPMQLTALWWGFGPQVVGQWLLLLLAVMLSRRAAPTHTLRAVAGLTFFLALLTHHGVAVLGGVWIGGYLMLRWFFDAQNRSWRGWILTFGGSVLLTLLFLYAEVVPLQFQGAATGATASQRFDDAARITMIGQGLLASWRPLSLPLVLVGLATLMWRIRTAQRWLVGTWLASAAMFLAVDVVFALQVRYAYFAMPLVCAGCGLLLAELMTRELVG